MPVSDTATRCSPVGAKVAVSTTLQPASLCGESHSLQRNVSAKLKSRAPGSPETEIKSKRKVVGEEERHSSLEVVM